MADNKRDDETLISKITQMLPPWRDVMANGEISPVTYGPESVTVYANEVKKFKESRAGGGTWDPDKADRYLKARHSRRRQQRAKLDLPDQEALDKFMKSHRHQVPIKELEVWNHVYVNGQAIRWTAAKMQISRDMVRTYLSRLHLRFERHRRGEAFVDGKKCLFK